MYTPKQVTAAAERAAQITATKLAADPEYRFVRIEDLIEMSGLTPPGPDETSQLVYKAWGFNVMKLRQDWRQKVLDDIGRWPKTIRGVGFELLDPPKNIQHADTKVLHDITRVIQKGLDIIRKTRNSALTSAEVRRKIQSELRFSALNSAARSAELQAERERMWREEPSTPQSTTPQTQPQDDS